MLSEKIHNFGDVQFQDDLPEDISRDGCVGLCAWRALKLLGYEGMDAETFDRDARSAGCVDEAKGWMHAPLGKYLNNLGYDMVSLTGMQSHHDVGGLLNSGRINSQEAAETFARFIDSLGDIDVVTMMEKIRSELREYSPMFIVSVTPGFNGYFGITEDGSRNNSTHGVLVLPDEDGQSYLIWDSDKRPYLNNSDAHHSRPEELVPVDEATPGLWRVSADYLRKYATRTVITVWPKQQQ